MADYFSQTVIQQPIPVADMTPLEHLVLEQMFQSDDSGDTVYFYHEDGPRNMIWLDRDHLAAALKASPQEGALGELVAASFLKASPNNCEIMIDLSAISSECILQDIVSRSGTLRYLTIVTSYTCSKMRADAFGGEIEDAALAAAPSTEEAHQGHP